MKSSPSRGFTLIELTVVVALIAIATTLGIKMLGAQLENSAQSATRTRQLAIREALISFYGRNLYLPCPDTGPGVGAAVGFSAANPPDGRENRQTAGAPAVPVVTDPCPAATIGPPLPAPAGVVSVGIVPFAELGLSRDTGIDGWGNFFNYVVTVRPPNALALPAAQGEWNIPNPLDIKLGAIQILDRDPGSAPVPLTTQAVVAIISRGPNGFGGMSAVGLVQIAPPVGNLDEGRNNQPEQVDPPTIFARAATEAPGAPGAGPPGPIDDIVLFLTANELTGPLVRTGVLQSGVAVARQLTLQARNALIANLVNTANAVAGPTCPLPGTANVVPPPVIPVALGIGNDPWNQPLRFDQGALVNIAATSMGTIRIFSSGPNQIPENGLGDDIVTPILAQELAGILDTAVPGFAAKCTTTP
jgi:prepilin-type N-terminal cleavage/methylation domain-containing protein